MAKELYVGHISEQATEEDLRKLFSLMGPVTSVHLIVDQGTGEFKRCGYVRMLASVDLKEVVETLDGTWLIDRCIVVSIAKPQKDRPAKSPFIRRKPVAAPRPAATDGTTGSKQPTAAKKVRSTPTATGEAVKSGRAFVPRDAAGKSRPAVTRDAAKSERQLPAKRSGRPVGGKKSGETGRAPSKGRR